MSTVPTNHPSNPVPGAVYIDTATNYAYVWTGNGWAQSSGSSGYNSQIKTGAAILPGYFADPSPESFITAVGTEPATPGEGQIWVDTSLDPAPAYVWHDSAWYKITDGTFTDTTVNTVPPASPDTGDSYFETTTNRFYVWDGTAWKIVGESDDTNSIYSMSTPVSRVNGGALQGGDLWVNSVSGTLSYHNGSSWILVGLAPTSTDTHGMADATNAAPTITARTDGNALQNADQFIDTGTGLLYYYDSALVTWKQVNSNGRPLSYTGSAMATEGFATNSDSMINCDITAITISDPTANSDLPVGALLQFIAAAPIIGQTINFTSSGPNFLDGTSTYSWTPAATGEILKLMYLGPNAVSDGLGIVTTILT